MTDREQDRLKKQLEQMRKNPGNRKCANCASMAVPYVCLDYGTFVCTRCSALHRELTHRVKSITASKFKPEEVYSIKGNEHDFNLYLKSWSETVFKLPSAGNEDTPRAREFMQIKYIEKRWADESIKPQSMVASPQSYHQEAAQQPAYQPTVPAQYPTTTPAQFGYTTTPGVNPFGTFGAAPLPAPAQAYAPVPAAVAQTPSPPVVEDPFADIFGGAPAATAPAAPVPTAPAPAFNYAPSFNPAAAPAAPAQTYNQQNHVYPSFQPRFDAGAFVSHPQAPAAKTGNMNNLFGDMVSYAVKTTNTYPAPAKPAAPGAVAPAAPAKKFDDLLDF